MDRIYIDAEEINISGRLCESIILTKDVNDLNRQFQKQYLTTRFTLVVALGGSLLTLVQIILLASDQNGICFSESCEIVDSLARISPLYFNVCGLVFFQVVLWVVWVGRNRQKWQNCIRMFLLAGLTAEGVLVSYQYFVAKTFCTYCLIVFSLVVLLNLLGGLRQALTGAATFAAVMIAFSSLQFTATPSKSTGIKGLEAGTYAILPGKDVKQKLVLFFSSTCPHCEDVIESMRQGTTCTVRFNPVDKITAFPIAGVIPSEQYAIEVNRSFLKSLGQNHVPVLLVEQRRQLQLISGGNAIKTYLNKSCRPTSVASKQEQSQDLFESSAGGFVLQLQDDSCSEDMDCEEAEREQLQFPLRNNTQSN